MGCQSSKSKKYAEKDIKQAQLDNVLNNVPMEQSQPIQNPPKNPEPAQDIQQNGTTTNGQQKLKQDKKNRKQNNQEQNTPNNNNNNYLSPEQKRQQDLKKKYEQQQQQQKTEEQIRLEKSQKQYIQQQQQQIAQIHEPTLSLIVETANSKMEYSNIARQQTQNKLSHKKI